VSFLLKRKAHLINEDILDLLFDLAGAASTSLMGDGLREYGSALAQGISTFYSLITIIYFPHPSL
jgi:hypothetical protein